MNKNFQNFQNSDQFKKLQQMMQTPRAFRTSPGLKFGVSLLCGVMPMLIAWIFFRTSEEVFIDPLFQDPSLWLPVAGITYGLMWGIAWGMIAISVVSVVLLIRFSKEIRLDCFIPTIGMAFLIGNFYLLPQIGAWRWLSVWGVWILGTIFAQILLIFYVIFKMQKEMYKIQEEMRRKGINPFDQFNNPNQNQSNQNYPNQNQSNQNPNDYQNNSNPFDNQQSTSNINNPPQYGEGASSIEPPIIVDQDDDDDERNP